MNEVDDLLAADSASWRQHVDAALARSAADPLEIADRPTRRWRYTAPLLSAAAVAIVGVVSALLITTSGDGSHHRATGATGDPATSVPSVAVGSTDAKKPALAAGWSRAQYPLADMITATEAQGLTSMPWRLAGIDDTRSVLAITYVAGGGCASPRGIYVHETATTVLIEALSRTTSTGQQSQSPYACAAYLRDGRATIQLQQPLGDRQLLHGQTNSPASGQAVTLPQSTWYPSPAASYMGAPIRGTLRLQANDCVRIEEPGGQMTTILWPRGYTAVHAGSEVRIVAPNGTEVARTGSSFSSFGGYIDVAAGTQPCAVGGAVFEINQDLTNK
jgi:hypothetical protein